MYSLGSIEMFSSDYKDFPAKYGTAVNSLNEDSEQFKMMECFKVIFYDKTSNLDSMNECRRIFFRQKGKTIEDIHPTREALL